MRRRSLPCRSASAQICQPPSRCAAGERSGPPALPGARLVHSLGGGRYAVAVRLLLHVVAQGSGKLHAAVK